MNDFFKFYSVHTKTSSLAVTVVVEVAGSSLWRLLLNQMLTKLVLTVPVLKELLKDKGIAFSSKAKKSELVNLFKTAHHNTTSGRVRCMKVTVLDAMLPCTRFTAPAYNGILPNPKQYFFVNKQPL